MKNYKVLILSCGTRGRHNSAALAVQENLIEKGICADFVEYLDIINPKLKNRVNRLYIKTTHLFAAQALTSIKKEYPIHFIAISTDYVCIPFCEETNPDYFIIPHKDLEIDFFKKGINKEKLLPFGISVSESF